MTSNLVALQDLNVEQEEYYFSSITWYFFKRIL